MRYWDKIKEKINSILSLNGLFNDNGKAIVQNDDGIINHKFFLFCAYNKSETLPWNPYALLNSDAPGYKLLKKFKKDGNIETESFNFIPKVLDDIIREYWMNQMKDIKTIPQLIEFLKQQKDNSIPNYKREYCDRPANENDLTDPNVSLYDENIFKMHIIENYILSDKIDEILKSYPNYEFSEDEVLTIAKNINSGAILLGSYFFIAPDGIECEIKNKKFKSKFNEIRELANES